MSQVHAPQPIFDQRSAAREPPPARQALRSAATSRMQFAPYFIHFTATFVTLIAATAVLEKIL